MEMYSAQPTVEVEIEEPSFDGVAQTPVGEGLIDASADEQRYAEPSSVPAVEAPVDPYEGKVFTLVPPSKELGRMGEEQAAKWLVKKKGYEIVERNWRCELGEVDIIALPPDESCMAFIEVKTRSCHANECKVFPEMAVDANKQYQYRRLASMYLSFYDTKRPIRFDVVAVNLAGPELGHLRFISNAFQWDE